MKIVVAIILIPFLACSCSLSQFSYWGERTERVNLSDEQQDEAAAQESGATDRERAREDAAAKRTRAGLARHAECPRCYRDVLLTEADRDGDKVTCTNCGKTFVLGSKAEAEH